MSSSGYSKTGIYYEEIGSGDPVLLIPGWAGSTQDLRSIEDALAPRYRVIAADPPGSGRSRPQPRRYEPSYLRDDARAFLALVDELQARPVHVVGYSDGGEYALLMAQIDPKAVRSIVTWGAVGRIALSIDFLKSWAGIVDDPIPPLQDFSEYLKDAYGVENARVMITSHADALLTLVEAGGDLAWESAEAIRCPALLITGEQDLYFAPPSLVSDLAEAIPGAHFIQVAGVGHAVHQSRPDWLSETIIGWLGDH